MTPGADVEVMMMLRGVEISDRKQQLTWRSQTDEPLFTALSGYISAGNDINSLPIDLLTDSVKNLDKRWADHNNSKHTCTTCFSS